MHACDWSNVSNVLILSYCTLITAFLGKVCIRLLAKFLTIIASIDAGISEENVTTTVCNDAAHGSTIGIELNPATARVVHCKVQTTGMHSCDSIKVMAMMMQDNMAPSQWKRIHHIWHFLRYQYPTAASLMAVMY